jgi:DNA-binding CsgD family transcriptional regulator
VSRLVGRDAPLGRLEHFLDGLVEGPVMVRIEGAAGLGKTTVWQSCLDSAARRGYRVLVARPTESETRLAYAGLCDLLAGTDDSCLDALPGPQRYALDVALLRVEPSGRPEPRAVFTGFGGALRALARQGPVLVAVDDEQWLDGSTRRAVEYVSRRLGDESIGVLTTARPRAEHLWSPEETVLELGSLSPAAVHRLIQDRVGVSLNRPTLLRLHRMTDGNPFFALQVAAVLVTAGLPSAHDSWPVPEDLRDIVAARMAGLPAPVRSTLLAAAAATQPMLSALDAALVEQADRAGVVTVDGEGRVRFAHPLFASAIYQGASATARRRVHARLAQEADDLEERARHAARACEEVDEQVAVLLDRAANLALARGAPDVAAELAERASDLTPPDHVEHGWQRRQSAAEFLLLAGDLERAHDLAGDLAATCPPGPDRSRALGLLGEVSYRLGRLHDALHALREAADSADGDAWSIARAELTYAVALGYSFGSFADADAAVRRAVLLLEGHATQGQPVDGGLLGVALAESVVFDVLLGRGLDQARLDRALMLEDPHSSIPVELRPSVIAGWVWFQTEQLDRARTQLEGVQAHLIEHGEDSELPEVLVQLARGECLAGRLAAAGLAAERGYEIARQAGSDSLAAHAMGVRALVHAHQGNVDETRAAAQEAIGLATRSGLLIGAFWASNAVGLLEVSLGRHDAALSVLARSVALVEEQGVVEPSRRPFLPDAIEALVGLGDLDRADRLTCLLDERARALHYPTATLAAARCRALVGAARGDPGAALNGLDHVLAVTPTVPVPLELARTLIVKGQLERRRKHKRNAVESLGRALTMCDDIGAVLWARRASAELARLGPPDHDPLALTATEGRIARLAASGLTNREVAAEAFISQKTVEANISRIYRKLGIGSRAELGAWLATGDHPAERPAPPPRQLDVDRG